ncbi:MAG: transglycosylase SLT domain-containing protein [Phycisphaerales bacterium]
MQDYLSRLAQIESSNNPYARNPNSSAKGLYQFIDSTAKQYGITAPFGTPEYTQQEQQAVMRFTEDNRNALRQFLGREPTQGELYLAHQQGVGGAKRILSNPDARAVDLVGEQAINLNAGNPNMTAEQFAQQWTGKFDEPQMTSNEAQLTINGQDQNFALQEPTGRQIQLPDGRVLSLTGQETPEQLQALKEKLRLKYKQEAQPVEQPNKIMENVVRPVGRAGRSFATGLASLADVPATPLKAALLGTGIGAQKLGADSLGQFLINLGQTPSYSEQVKGGIDKLTGGYLKPRGTLEKVQDIGGEIATGAVAPMGALSKVPQALGSNQGAVQTTLKTLAAPETAFKSNRTPVTSEELRALANVQYKVAEKKGGIVVPQAVDNFLNNVTAKVKPKDAVASQLTKDDPAREALDILESAMRGQPMTLDRFQAIDQALTTKIDNFYEFGKLKADGLNLVKIQDELRSLVENVDANSIEGGKEAFDALKEGRKLWSQSARVRDIESVISRAEMSEQPANAIKSGFRTLANNPNRMRGYSAEQKDMIKKIAKEGIAMESLRGIASRLFGIGNAVVNGPAGFVLGKGMEMGARGIRENVMTGRAQNIINNITGYTPSYNPLLTGKGNLGLLGGLSVTIPNGDK